MLSSSFILLPNAKTKGNTKEEKQTGEQQSDQNKAVEQIKNTFCLDRRSGEKNNKFSAKIATEYMQVSA